MQNYMMLYLSPEKTQTLTQSCQSHIWVRQALTRTVHSQYWQLHPHMWHPRLLHCLCLVRQHLQYMHKCVVQRRCLQTGLRPCKMFSLINH